ncbi:sterol desaturase family protein [Sphingomonas sp. BIUV-7]|uniref:Sterol desaturase family protein n=1 Tax=Sphingomonas natans TaxID=3063330 RepID=A0ABT8YAB4_9SPHN|nr:sterol desaturase family protein [Sphingomonas sp. BIUV-7]MDO6415255.1 sterol desaturase family protein [Sphingomonas sp. BIUV-7]
MNGDGSAVDQVFAAFAASYSALLVSLPLVLAGILLTGSLFYFGCVRPHLPERGFRIWMTYLFPKEMYTSRSGRVDFGVWLANGLIFIPLFEVAVIVVGLVAGVTFKDALVDVFGPAPQLVTVAWAAVAIQFFGFWFGQGIGQYSGHYAMHRVPLLWALHRAHHSAESANLFAFLRSHPLEHFVNGATRVLGTAVGTSIGLYVTTGDLLPATTATIFWYNIIYVLIGFRSVDHLHIPVSYGRVLDVVLGSPVMHQLHHSAEPQHMDKNMAGAGYIFDWLFGTLYVPAKGETWRWGLNDAELGDHNPHNTLREFYLEPLRTMRLETGKLFPWRRNDRKPPSSPAGAA